MDILSSGLVYATYTIYLLLAIVGFLTKVDMPQIGLITLATARNGEPTTIVVNPMGAVPGKTANWSTTSYPELGRARMSYTHRKADPGTGLARHTFKVTLPTLKSVVTDPSGPYAPPPQLDYVTVAELVVYVHPRSTLSEREAAIAAITRSILVGGNSFEDMVAAVASGQSVF